MTCVRCSEHTARFVVMSDVMAVPVCVWCAFIAAGISCWPGKVKGQIRVVRLYAAGGVEL